MGTVVILNNVKGTNFEYFEPFLLELVLACQLAPEDFALHLEQDKNGLSVSMDLVARGVLGWEAIGKFGIIPFPDCCGICIATKGGISNTLYLNKGIGEIINRLRIQISKRMGYGLMFCTTTKENKFQQKLLEKLGWKEIAACFNKKTDNNITVHTVSLQ